MIRKPPAIELALMKNALQFLSEEWLQLADAYRLDGATQTDIPTQNYFLGQADTYAQTAEALYVLINKVELQILDDNMTPVSIAREVVRETANRR